MPANALMTEIHNVKHRMPAILAKEDRDAWLTAPPEDAFQLLPAVPRHPHGRDTGEQAGQYAEEQ
jgi:putative SOS response-associated peptidase YedK